MARSDRVRRWARAGVAVSTLVILVPGAPQAVASASGVSANPVVTWDQNAQTAIWDIAQQQPWEQSRSFAMVHGAVYDAVNAIAGTRYQPYLAAPRANGKESVDAAVATAAHDVLAALFPGQQARLQEQYDQALAAIPDGRSKRSGIAVGAQTAATMVAARQDDGAFGPQTWVIGTQPGQWRPTPPFFGAAGAWVGHMRPFLISSGSTFRTSGPPALTSPAYARDLNEVKLIGSASSTVRTQDQTEAAIWWHDRRLTDWEIRRQLASTQRLTVLQTARLFAMLEFISVDSAIACFNEKEAWNFWRPVTAIQLADTDGNPATAPDPGWMPLLITPPFPDYTSGHACATGAITTTYASFFGRDRISFSAFSADSGTTRSFTSFSQARTEVINARVWGGIHFRTADVQGTNIGIAVSHFVTARFFKPLK